MEEFLAFLSRMRDRANRNYEIMLHGEVRPRPTENAIAPDTRTGIQRFVQGVNEKVIDQPILALGRLLGFNSNPVEFIEGPAAQAGMIPARILRSAESGMLSRLGRRAEQLGEVAGEELTHHGERLAKEILYSPRAGFNRLDEGAPVYVPGALARLGLYTAPMLGPTLGTPIMQALARPARTLIREALSVTPPSATASAREAIEGMTRQARSSIGGDIVDAINPANTVRNIKYGRNIPAPLREGEEVIENLPMIDSPIERAMVEFRPGYQNVSVPEGTEPLIKRFFDVQRLDLKYIPKEGFSPERLAGTGAEVQDFLNSEYHLKFLPIEIPVPKQRKLAQNLESIAQDGPEKLMEAIAKGDKRIFKGVGLGEREREQILRRFFTSTHRGSDY